MNARRRLVPALLACVLAAAAPVKPTPPARLTPSVQPSPPPPQSLFAAPTPTPTPPGNVDLRMIRMKISAGDLPSAESILESHRAEVGEYGDYTLGVAWLARGAALVGDWKAASAWSKSARQIAEKKLKMPADYESEKEAVYALGTAIEIEAQALAAAGKRAEAVRFLAESSAVQESAKAPFNLRARIWKRRNLLELEGKPAPPIPSEDRIGAEVPTLESLRGKPVVLFFWWEACGDLPQGRREVCRQGRRVSRADALLRSSRRARRREREDPEGLERALRADRQGTGCDQRRRDAALRGLLDADVRVRRPQGDRPALLADPDERGAALRGDRGAAALAPFRVPGDECPPATSRPPHCGQCIPSARARNAANSPRVKFWFGQKFPFPQPLVTPAAASASIARK